MLAFPRVFFVIRLVIFLASNFGRTGLLFDH